MISQEVRQYKEDITEEIIVSKSIMKRNKKGFVILIMIFIISLLLACGNTIPPQYLESESYDYPIIYASQWEETDIENVMLREFLIFDSDSNVCIMSSSKSKRYVLNNYKKLCNNTTTYHPDNGYTNHYYFEFLSKYNTTYRYIFSIDSKKSALVLIEIIDEDGKVLISNDKVYNLIHVKRNNQK